MIIICLGFLFSSLSHSASLNGFDGTYYGFIKTSATYASEALASFNNVNLGAPTHAVPHTKSTDSTSRTSMQSQQSRVGLTLSKDKLVQAKLEVDFVDFSKSSPSVQMNPRLRVASVTYRRDSDRFIIGQDLDMFSPVTAYTYNYVGQYFLAGNTGFLRQQAQYLKSVGSWEIGAAIGMANSNPTTTDADLELGKSPSYVARAAHEIEKGRVGVSAIYSTLKYTVNDTRHEGYGLNAFYEQEHSIFTVKTEVYYGQNLANVGTLAIGKGTEINDVKELGGHLSAQMKLSDTHSIFGGLGMAKADNPQDVSPFAMNTLNSIGAPGIRSNFVSRVGWEWKVTEDLFWLAEVTKFETQARLTQKNETNIVYGLESGITLKF